MKRFHIQSKNQVKKEHIENEKNESDDEADVEDDNFNHQSNQNGYNLRSSQTLSKNQKYFAQKKKKDITATTQNASTFVNNSSSYEDQLVNSVQQFSAISQKEYLKNKQPVKHNQYYTSSEAETAAAKAHPMINSQNLSRLKLKLPLQMESHHEKLAKAKDLIQKRDETEEEQYSHSHDHQQLDDAGTQDQHIAEEFGYPKIQDIQNGWDCHPLQKYSKQIAHNESFPKFKKRVLRSHEAKKNNVFNVFEFKNQKSLSCHNEKNLNDLMGGISNRNKKQSLSKIGLSDIKHNNHQFNEENFTQNKQTEKFAMKNNFSYYKTNDDCETLQQKKAIINISENEQIIEFKESIISRTNKSIQFNHNEEGLHNSIISLKQKYKEVQEQQDFEKYQNENKNVQSKIFEFSQGLPTFRSQSNDFSQSNKNLINNFQQIEVINVDYQELSMNLQINLQECRDSFTTSQKNNTTMNQIHDTKKNEFQNTNKKFTITKKADIENLNRMKAVTFTNNDFSNQIHENELKKQILEEQKQLNDNEQNYIESPLIVNQNFKNEHQQLKSYSQIVPANEHHKILNNEYNQNFFVESPELKDILVKITNEDNQSFENKFQKQNQVQKKFEIKKQIIELDIFRQQSVAVKKDDELFNFPLSKFPRRYSMKELNMKDYNDPENQYFINYQDFKQKTEMSNKQIYIENITNFKKQNTRQHMRTQQNIHDCLRSPFDNTKHNQLITRTERSSNREEAGTSDKSLPDKFNYCQGEEMFKSINNNDNYQIDNIDKRIQQISPIERHNFQTQEFQFLNRVDVESIHEEQKEYNDVTLENQSCPEKLERNTDGDLIRQYNQQTGSQSLQKEYFEQVDMDSSSMAQVETQILKNRIKCDKHLYQNQSEADVIKQQQIDLQKDLEITIEDVLDINNNSENLETHKSQFQPIIESQILRKSNLFQHNQYQSDDEQQILDIRDQEVEENLQDIQSSISNNLNQQVEQVEISRKINYSANNEKIKDKNDYQKKEVLAQQLIRKANSLYRIDQQLSPEKLISNENCLIDQQQFTQDQSINDKILTNEIIDQNGSSEEANIQNYQQKTFYIQKSSLPYQLNENENSLSENNVRQNQVAMKIFKIENKDEINIINHSDGFIQKFDDKQFQQESDNLMIEDKISIQKRKEDLKKLIQEDKEFQKQQSFHQDENLKKINQSFDYQKNIQKNYQKKINKTQYLTGEKQGKYEIITSRKKVDSQKAFIKKQIYEDNIDEEKMSENEIQSLQSNQKFNNNYIKYENQKLRQNIQQMDHLNQNIQSFSQPTNNLQNNFEQFQQNKRNINIQNENFSYQKNRNQNYQSSQNKLMETPVFENYKQPKYKEQQSNIYRNYQQQEQFEEPGIFNPQYEQQSDQQHIQNQQFHQFQLYKKFASQKSSLQQNPFDQQYMNRFTNSSCHCQCQPNFQQTFPNMNNFQNIQNFQQFNSEQNILSQMKSATINQINMNINYLKYIEQKEFQLKQIQDYQEFLEFQQFANIHK